MERVDTSVKRHVFTLNSLVDQVNKAKMLRTSNESEFKRLLDIAVLEMRAVLAENSGLRSMLSNLTSKTSNIVLKAQDEESEMSVGAHHGILSARSPVFQAMFSDSYKESGSGVVLLKEFPPAVLGAFVLFFYQGEYGDYSHLKTDQLFHLLRMAGKYDVNGLHNFVVKMLTRKKLTYDQAFSLIQVAKSCGAKNLVCKCLDVIASEEKTDLASSSQFEDFFWSLNVGDRQLAFDMLRHREQLLKRKNKSDKITS